MELAYFYDAEKSGEMDKLMDEEFFKRLGPTIRECKMMGMDKPGFYVYVKARDELAEEAKKLLSESPAKPLEGEENETVLKAFREEAESAEAGMGALFG